jgi:hypothetical protein
LCLSAFYWVTFRSTKGGIKLHTQLEKLLGYKNPLQVFMANFKPN